MLALPLVSCQTTIEDTGNTAVAAPEIFAEVETQPATKTQLVVDGGGEGTIYWKPGDEINVFYGTTSTHYTSQNTSNVTTAVFRTTDVIGDTECENIWGLYPYDANAICDGYSVNTTLPHVQYGVSGTFDDDLFITLAHSNTTDLNFYNLCGGIKFSLSRDDITSIKFKGNNNEYLAGGISVSLFQGLPAATVLNGKKEITLYPATGSTFEKNQYYYFILLPQKLSKGFTMTFTTSGGTSGTFNHQTNPNDVLKVVTIKRSIFKTQANIDQLSNLPAPAVVGDYNKVLFLGNSITKHGICDYWWGLWGMAATTRENDYVHKVMAVIQSHTPSATFSAVNIANWEQDFSTPLSSLISSSDLSAETDLIVIRLGENVKKEDISRFETELTNLYDYATGIAPNARVIITGQFWVNSAKETACRNVANAKHATFVQINQYGSSSVYMESIGNSVYGDDGQWHVITRADVASHPSDAGMQGIANEILSALYN